MMGVRLLLLLLQGKGNASTVQQLDALMHEIGSNKQRYEKMLAWKHKKVRSGCSGAVAKLRDAAVHCIAVVEVSCVVLVAQCL
jgi:hypothetical protein